MERFAPVATSSQNVGHVALNERREPGPLPGEVSAATHLNRAHGVPAGLAVATASSADRARTERVNAALAEHFELVWRTLRRLGVETSRLDDAAQHVFLTFTARVPEIDAARERAFLVGAAVRVAANARRLRARSREVPAELEPNDANGLTPEELFDWKQRRELLDRALDTLNSEQRSVFVLYELEGFSLPEIAELLNVPLGTASSRLTRARAGFEAWVEKQQREGGLR
jgi:RNA polymerase sigma-70 factor, ECF subfamily